MIWRASAKAYSIPTVTRNELPGLVRQDCLTLFMGDSSDRVRPMPILVTVSVNLAESVTLRDLRLFLQAAERNGADLDVDLREYDENNDLVGLAAVGADG